MEGSSIQKDSPSPNRDLSVSCSILEGSSTTLEERLGRKIQAFQELEHRTELLMADNDAFKQERVVLKQEILQLHDEMELVRVQANLYKQDFLQEREDREVAHNLKEDIRLTCDQRVHAKDIECDELTHRNEMLVRELTELREELDRQRGDSEALKTESEATLEQNGVLVHRLKELTQQLEEAQAKVASTKKGLSDIENDNSFLRGEVVQCQQQAAEAKERVENERKEFDQILKGKTQHSNEEIASFRQQISEAEKTASLSEEKRKKTTDLLNSCCRELECVRRVGGEWREELDRARETIGEWKKQNATLGGNQKKLMERNNALTESNIELKKALSQLQQKLQSSLSLVATKDLQTGGIPFKDSHYQNTHQASRAVTIQADTLVPQYRGAHIASHNNHGQSDVKYPLQDVHSSYPKQRALHGNETLETSQSLTNTSRGCIELSLNPQVTGVCHLSGQESLFGQQQSQQLHTTFNHNPHSIACSQSQYTTNPVEYKSPQQSNHPQRGTEQATPISYAQLDVPDIEAHLYVNLLEDDTLGNTTPPGPVQNQHLYVNVSNPDKCDKCELVIENEASICDGCSEQDMTTGGDDAEDTHYMNLPHRDDDGQYMNLPPKR